MGCFIATNYTTNHPDRVRALVLQSPWSHHIPHVLVFFLYVLPGFAELLAFVVTRAVTTVRTRTLANILRHHNQRGGWDPLLKQFAPNICASHNLQSVVDFPLLLISGDAAPAESGMRAQAAQIAVACGHSEDAVVVLPGAGHASWFMGDDSQRDFFKNEIAGWIAGLNYTKVASYNKLTNV